MKKKDGVALIVVLLAICAVIPVVLELQRTVRQTTSAALNERDREILYQMANSGFNIGQAVLMNREEKPYVSLTQKWAQLAEPSGWADKLFPDGNLKIKIEDELGKIPLNMLISGNKINGEIKNMIIRLLCLPEFAMSQEQAEGIVAAIIDWIDADEEITPGGAESVYYRSRAFPYDAKGAPLDDIYELLMIKGITKDMFYGKANRPGLKDLLSLHGTGRININTAPLMVLRSLTPEITYDLAKEMDVYRRNEYNDLSDVMWYKKVKGMADITINRDVITVKSEIFRIHSQALLERMQRNVTGIVELQGQKKPKILSFRWDE
ncbi:MAG: type II secretion system minor pseudopilin GspK [Syntrophales bacterium]|nr:type II secretion system minor pseudopilin GspK [Syntrophales bacterium]